jgi:hypothetical protein
MAIYTPIDKNSKKTLQDKDSYFDLQKERKVTLVEVLDRVLDKGAVVSGDIVISIADVDLIYIGLKVLVSSVETMERLRGAPFSGATEEPT